ncbi:hypothetical protein D3C71_2179850 [compost metagenome]
MLFELADRLIHQHQRDAVFPAVVAGILEHAHEAEQIDLIEHEECAAVEGPVGLDHGIDQ